MGCLHPISVPLRELLAKVLLLWHENRSRSIKATRISVRRSRISLSVDHTRVVTSGRRAGRAPHGFAEALAAHNEAAA
jgi:hypothetical protein